MSLMLPHSNPVNYKPLGVITQFNEVPTRRADDRKDSRLWALTEARCRGDVVLPLAATEALEKEAPNRRLCQDPHGYCIF